jgi:dipeptidyl aminopeptidase/acylaminoacyl peptidase
VNTQTGKSIPIARNVSTYFYRLSPTGTKLLYTVATGIVSGDINARVVYDVYIADVASGSSERIARGILSNLGSLMSWSHDESKIAFVGGNLQNDASVLAGNYGFFFPARCYLIDLQHPGVLRALSNRAFERTEIWWSNNDSTIYAKTWDRSGIVAIAIATQKAAPLLTLHHATISTIDGNNGGYLSVFVTTDDGATRIQKVDMHSGNSTTLFHGFTHIDDVSFSRSGGGPVAYIQEDVAHPADVWVADSGFRNPHQLTYFNPQIEQRLLSDAEESITWHARNGARLDGVLLLPAGYQVGRRYPTILWVYAGEKIGSAHRNDFGMFGEQREGSYFNLELLASRGYVVFVPNSVLRVGHPMRDIAATILPGVDKIVAMGIADPARLGVFGQSYGGYSTLSLIVQTNRFKVAIATSGISDLVSQYGFLHEDGSDWTGWSESEQGRMGGTPWQYRDRYIENSPFFYLDRVHTPVLLEYGDVDDSVAPFNSCMAFVALRRLGKEAVLVGYANEGHVLAKTSNQIDFTNRMLDWFAKYLIDTRR